MKVELSEFLDQKYRQYNTKDFIAEDPISIPHRFSIKQDIEISGLLAATIAWGNRKSILKSAERLMEAMDHAPYQFVREHQNSDLKRLEDFVHRTFQFEDLLFFLSALKELYAQSENQSLEDYFLPPPKGEARDGLIRFREAFLAVPHLPRSEKHLSSPLKNSACKRLNMYLRWMVRSDKAGVDFGLWKRISTSQLSIPLDVHTGNVARALGLLKRKQSDWKSVEELDQALRELDPVDPVKYDFALFGLGVYEGFR